MRTALVILPATLVLAGCGAAGSMTAGQPMSPASSKHAIVKTRHGKLGTFLVDGSGNTLYLFRKDTTRRSRCAGDCAQAWPPLITQERPEARGAARAALLSTSRRSNGARQVVYNGHPLYRFASDSAPGQTNGENVNAFGARWFVVSPSGRAIRPGAAPAGSPTPSPYPY